MALSKNPEDRPKNAAAIAESLESWLDRDLADRITKHTRTRMIKAMAIVAAIGALAVGALFFLLR